MGRPGPKPVISHEDKVSELKTQHFWPKWKTKKRVILYGYKYVNS